VASRLQASFEELDVENVLASRETEQEPVPGAIEPGGIRHHGVTTPGAPRGSDKGAQRQIDDLVRQLAVLRDQLDLAFDEFDQRLEAAETRASVAEARASVAEARASVAETRATDAEARANLAHTRIDEVVAYISQDEQDGPLESAGDDSAPTLRSALDRLRGRLDVG
jgi:hypothetical protein